MSGENQQFTVTAEHRSTAETVVANVMERVKGSDEVAKSQAAYIVAQRLVSQAQLPAWVIEMLKEFVLELIQKWLDSRKAEPKSRKPEPDVPPAVKSGADRQGVTDV